MNRAPDYTAVVLDANGHCVVARTRATAAQAERAARGDCPPAWSVLKVYRVEYARYALRGFDVYRESARTLVKVVSNE